MASAKQQSTELDVSCPNISAKLTQVAGHRRFEGFQNMIRRMCGSGRKKRLRGDHFEGPLQPLPAVAALKLLSVYIMQQQSIPGVTLS